jgi:hypothetical protein
MGIDPEIQASYDIETQFLQSQTRGARRVKMERGRTWMIRFIPAKLGPKGTWYARIARHWLSMKPIICPRYTSPDFGGDPEAYCPCCEISEILNDSADEAIAKFGFAARSSPQWLTFCIVWDKDGVEQPTSEIMVPYEFQHYKNTFEELMGFFRAGQRRCPLSVLDYKLGNDFAVTRTGKGMRLDKQDSAPIFDPSDANFKAYIEKIEAAIKLPKIKIPTGEELQAFSHKIEEASNKLDEPAPREGGGGGSRLRRRPSSVDAEMDENDDGDQPYQRSVPARTPARTAPQTRAAPARRPVMPEDEQPPEPDDTNPELAPQPQPMRRASAPVPERAPSSDDLGPQQPQEEEPPARRSLSNAPQKLPPSVNRARAAAEAAAATPEEPAEEEAMPEEARDPVPPAETPLDEAAPLETPPPVNRRPLSTSIKGRIQSMSKRGA